MQWENDELICIDSIGKVPTRWDFNELITMRPESLIRQVKVQAWCFFAIFMKTQIKFSDVQWFEMKLQ